MALGGLSLQILKPIEGERYSAKKEIPVELSITLDCGCPTCFKKVNFKVESYIITPKGEKEEFNLHFNPNLSVFNGKIIPSQKGQYSLYIRAIDLESGRAGEKNVRFYVT